MQNTVKNEKKEKLFTKKDFIYYTVLFGAVILFFVFQKYVFFFPKVSGDSMMNTLIDKQRMGCKIVHDIEDYERFDIVIAKETNGVQIVKRIIGLPGEEVFIDENGNIYIDGNILEEHYGKETIKDPGNAFHIVTLGEDEFFLLGDNRNNSLDSRFDIVGPVPMERMRGKVVWYKDHSKPSE